MAYDNTNRGSIWKNDKKVKDTDPDFTGPLNVEGVEYYVSGWKRKDGASPKAPALSFSIKRKDARPQEQVKPAKSPSRASDDLDDVIPF